MQNSAGARQHACILNMCHVIMHLHVLFQFTYLCVCVCVAPGSPCVRGAEHLNINNCHEGHLGPHSQLAPWAHSHHQHSCHREERGGEGGSKDRQREQRHWGGRGSRRQERNTQKEVSVCVCVHIWHYI